MSRTQTFSNSELNLSVRTKLNSTNDYNSLYSYNQNDVTHYNGSTYFSIADNNIGNTPNSSPNFWIFGSSISSSFAQTASFALNAGGGGGGGSTLTTGSTYQITSSWANTSSFLRFPSSSILTPVSSTNYTVDFNKDYYILTSSQDMSFSSSINRGAVKSSLIYIYNSTASRNLSFNSNWVFIGQLPSNLDSGSVGVLSLISFGPAESNVVAAFGGISSSVNYGAALSASYAKTASFSLNSSTFTSTIGSGVSSVTVSGLTLSKVPVDIRCSVSMPTSNSIIMFASTDLSSVTTNSFTAYLSGLTDSSGYLMQYSFVF